MPLTGRARFGLRGGAFGVLPGFPGKFRLVEWAGRVAFWAGMRETEFFPWPGVRFSVDLRDRIQRQMWAGCYEPHVSACLRAILRPGDSFLDIGAHVGYHSLLAAKLVGTSGRVFAFEPDPGLYARLTHNLGQFSHAQAFPIVVWEREARLVFERSSLAHESGWGTVTAVRELGTGEHIPVQAVSLDDWSRRVLLDSIRAMKIDAEGSEPAVLRGAQECLRKFRPILLVEVNDVLLQQAHESAEELGAALHRLQYRFLDLSPKGMRRITSLAEHTFSECVCLPEERVEELLAALRRHGFGHD